MKDDGVGPLILKWTIEADKKHHVALEALKKIQIQHDIGDNFTRYLMLILIQMYPVNSACFSNHSGIKKEEDTLCNFFIIPKIIDTTLYVHDSKRRYRDYPDH